MSQYIEPYVLFVLGIIICKYSITDTFSIILMLCAIIMISTRIVIRNHKFDTFIGVLAIIIAIVFPQYLAFIPAIAYSTIFNKNYHISIAYLIPLLVLAINDFSSYIIVWLLYAALSIYMAYNATLKSNLFEQVKTLRDTAVEHELALKSQNQQLIESQNDQIYIATLQERNRIAREIHDNVGHMLSSSILQVGALIAVTNAQSNKYKNEVASNPEVSNSFDAIANLLSTLKDTLNTAMDNIRNSVHDLHDESVDLKQSITNLCDQFTFCPITLHCEVSKFIPKEIKYCFITITKEALNNIIKHSNATHVDVTIKEHPGFYQLLIEDNGKNKIGSNPDDLVGNGIGLNNMQERVSKLNGILHIQTDKGFRIFISIPKK